MTDFLYTLIIFPLVQIIDFCFLFVTRVFHNTGLALIGVSIVVTVCTLPLYTIAERWQEIERNTIKKLKPKIDKIKIAFKGDEQYMIMSVFYRQNHYHPIFAMRSTFGLLIQIPFFIAAYSYLSHLPALRGASFLLISDLGAPDALLKIAGIHINILPIIMTVINIIAGMIYTRGFPAKDKIQLYAMAGIFLILLYNSPAGLVLYWTLNNAFSLIKHILHKAGFLKPYAYILLCLVALFLDVYVLFFYTVSVPKRIFFCILCSSVLFIPLIKKIYFSLKKIFNNREQLLIVTSLWQKRTFFFASIILFLLAGLVIPGALIASSTEEFSFIESYSSPFPFLLYTLLQSAGIFLFWPSCVYFLFSKKVKIILTCFMTFLCVAALINTFIFPEYYGFITITMILSEPPLFNTNILLVLVNALAVILAIALFAFLLFFRKPIIISSIQLILVISLAGLGFFNVIKTQKEYSELAILKSGSSYTKALSPVYNFSKTGKNVLVIMLDRAISGFVPYIFEEKPELASAFSGFIYYPNSVSFSSYTLIGAPPLFGGYDYSPEEINKRETIPLITKSNEASLLLPHLFSNQDYSITITDLPYTEQSIFNSYPSIHTDNLFAKYSPLWLEKHPDVHIVSISSLLKNNLIRFSLFKFAPPLLRIFIYDDGEWLTMADFNNNNESTGATGKLTLNTIDSYSLLDFLPEITDINDSDTNTLTILVSNLAHDPAFLQVPDYVPTTTVTAAGNGPFSQNPFYHTNMASYLLLNKWFTFLKENDVYDNTRIIIASDHGHAVNLSVDGPDTTILPNNKHIDQYNRYNALLLFKDFSESHEISSDDSFMTNADVPLLALDKLIDNPLNPFTKLPLKSNKDKGINITTLRLTDFNDHSKFKFTIPPNDWLHVHDTIFEADNWERVSLP